MPVRNFLGTLIAALAVHACFPGASLAVSFGYGQHYPNGDAAVAYLYGPEGTWKFLSNVEYIWNYYPQYATPNHPYDPGALISYANGTRMTTTRDAHGHLLLDLNDDGEIDVRGGSHAFHEHNGKGINGQQAANPFTNFWHDDNWVARYVSIAYGRPHPYGLSPYRGFNRWAILAGDASAWQLYNADFYDTLALDGLYFLAAGDVNGALANWERMVSKTGHFYDWNNQRFVYPGIRDNYHLGLFRILTEKLIDSGGTPPDRLGELRQHSVALRSAILSNQERNGTTSLGWRTGIGDTVSLINTETTAVNTLALAADSKFVFEAGRAPLFMNNKNYFLRPHNVLSAVNGLSVAGHMTHGPYWNFPTGSYQVEFLLRAPAPLGLMASLDVYDASTGQFLAQTHVYASSMSPGNQWTSVALDFFVGNPGNSLEFRTYWHGGPNMDVAYIRVR
jgi:hypothetical protein